jgi:hypothetical protein
VYGPPCGSVQIIVDSSVVGYDGARNGVDEERSVGQKNPEREQTEETKQSRWGFRGMTVRDWLAIVGALLVPLVIALGTGAITWQQGKIEDQRADAERELADQRAQDEALQTYLTQMSTLMLERDLRHAEVGDEIQIVARARTLAALGRLDPSRKTALMQFITEAGLVQGSINEKARGVVSEGTRLDDCSDCSSEEGPSTYPKWRIFVC